MRAVAERRNQALPFEMAAKGPHQARSLSFAMVSRAFTLLGLLVLFILPATASASPGYLGAFGPDGTEASEFELPAGLAVDQETGAIYVGDASNGVLYKFDEEGNPLDYGGTAGNITGNEITGLAIPGWGGVAVDSETHVVYVMSANKVRAFEDDGEPHEFTEGPGAGTTELPGGTELRGVAVDEFGNIYTSDLADLKIRIYSRSGALITEFETLAPLGSKVGPDRLAVAPDGTLYVDDRTHDPQAVYAFEPSSFPVSGQTTYGVGQQLTDNVSIAVAVDPGTQFVYVGVYCQVGTCQYENASHIGVYDELGNLIEFIGSEEPGVMNGSVSGIGINGEARKLYALVRGEGSNTTSQVLVFNSLTFFEGPPAISATAVTSLTSSSATLQANINPNTSETTYHFEYGTADCKAAPSACTSVPLDDGVIPAGHNPVPVSVDISGLSADTKYYYRVVAKNSFGVTSTPVRTLRTQVSAFGYLPMDGRVWEQVTPVDKFGGSVGNDGGVVQAAADGGAVTFLTRGSIVAGPESNRAIELSQTLAARSAGGWAVTDLLPPYRLGSGGVFSAEYVAFSLDLGLGLLEPHDPTPLSPEATSGFVPYLRTNSEPGVFRPLLTMKEGFANVPPNTIWDHVDVEGVNESLSHVAISIPRLGSTPAPGEEYSDKGLYIWHDGAVEPVSELPGGSNEVVTAQVGSGSISMRNAISSDGSRVFWSPGRVFADLNTIHALYLRDTEADVSVRLDAPQPGVAGTGLANPVFMGASSDGGVVFFTDSQQLTADASPSGRDLYRCVINDADPSLGCVQLENLSASLNGTGEDVLVEEVALGMGEDGGTLYFVEDAEKEKPRLYVWKRGVGVHLITSLSPGDHPNWGQAATDETSHSGHAIAASSPSGRYLTFMSEQSLTGQETDDPISGEPVEQAYRYDAAADSLVCISCNPNGSTDPGIRVDQDAEVGGNGLLADLAHSWERRRLGASLPESKELNSASRLSFYHPRAALDNGRVYFNSPSPLVTADSNGTWDAYQYEPFGVGTCEPGSRGPSIAVAEGACIGLISSGTDAKPSIFFDASQSGNDVFFGTSARLSVLDSDNAVDVYDARVGGVAAVAFQHPECLGEACQPPPAPPNDPTPASAAFSGPGNIKSKAAKHCRRGQRKVRKKGKVRCVKRRHHSKRHPSRRAGR